MLHKVANLSFNFGIIVMFVPNKVLICTRPLTLSGKMLKRTFLSQFNPLSQVSRVKNHSERRLVPYSMQEFYDVVAHVGKYRHFVPWCADCTVISRKEDGDGAALEARMEVGFGPFKEQYISSVRLDPPNAVTVKAVNSSILKLLETEWKFSPAKRSTTSCWISFNINFQFHSPLYEHASELFLQQQVGQMVKAFEERCATLYGKRDNR